MNMQKALGFIWFEGMFYNITLMKVNGSPNKYPHRKLLVNSGDISLPKHTKIKVAKQPSSLIGRPDKFTTFK